MECKQLVTKASRSGVSLPLANNGASESHNCLGMYIYIHVNIYIYIHHFRAKRCPINLALDHFCLTGTTPHCPPLPSLNSTGKPPRLFPHSQLFSPLFSPAFFSRLLLCPVFAAVPYTLLSMLRPVFHCALRSTLFSAVCAVLGTYALSVAHCIRCAFLDFAFCLQGT